MEMLRHRQQPMNEDEYRNGKNEENKKIGTRRKAKHKANETETIEENERKATNENVNALFPVVFVQRIMHPLRLVVWVKKCRCHLVVGTQLGALFLALLPRSLCRSSSHLRNLPFFGLPFHCSIAYRRRWRFSLTSLTRRRRRLAQIIVPLMPVNVLQFVEQKLNRDRRRENAINKYQRILFLSANSYSGSVRTVFVLMHLFGRHNRIWVI